jgi:hypothetical protein
MAAPIPWRSWPTPEAWRGTGSRWSPLAWGAALALPAWTAHGADPRLHELVRGAPYMADFLRRMFPPNLACLPKLVRPTLETLQMALLGDAPRHRARGAARDPGGAQPDSPSGLLLGGPQPPQRDAGDQRAGLRPCIRRRRGAWAPPRRPRVSRPHRGHAREVLRGDDGGRRSGPGGGTGCHRSGTAPDDPLCSAALGAPRRRGLQPLPARRVGAVGHRSRPGRRGRDRVRPSSPI